jgi:hypothetical protein
MGLILFALGLFGFAGLLFGVFWYSSKMTTRK